MLPGGVNGICRHCQILVNEFGREGLIGMNTANTCGGKYNDFWLSISKKPFRLLLLTQVNF